ncbi:MFS transporter [Streptomyces massasporeus]|uniref:MFS transporter n=1 Tax=Streptomyces massasporeus TaxID=67324 RepID=UPI0033C2CA06
MNSRGRDRNRGPVAAPRRPARPLRHADRELGHRPLRLPRPQPPDDRLNRPAGATTAAFSLGLVVSAIAGIHVGRILDRRGPRTVMTAGSALGVVSLLIVAAASNLSAFIAGWALAGLAMAATFYQPAFAALTRWWAPNHVRALTIVTLAGGLASTVFAPRTAALADHLSWRHTYLVLAGILAAVTIPAHALALRAPWPDAPTSPKHATAEPPGPSVSAAPDRPSTAPCTQHSPAAPPPRPAPRSRSHSADSPPPPSPLSPARTPCSSLRRSWPAWSSATSPCSRPPHHRPLGRNALRPPPRTPRGTSNRGAGTRTPRRLGQQSDVMR